MATILIIAGIWALVSAVFCVACCVAASRPVPSPCSQTILAIDDDPELLSITRMALEQEGYDVLTATSPKEALRFYETHWQTIKLVLLDFLMPEMTGDQVFQSLRAIDPQVPVLLVTGHYDRIQAGSLRNDVSGYLAKPFSLDALARKVQEAVSLA